MNTPGASPSPTSHSSLVASVYLHTLGELLTAAVHQDAALLAYSHEDAVGGWVIWHRHCLIVVVSELLHGLW